MSAGPAEHDPAAAESEGPEVDLAQVVVEGQDHVDGLGRGLKEFAHPLEARFFADRGQEIIGVLGPESGRLEGPHRYQEVDQAGRVIADPRRFEAPAFPNDFDRGHALENRVHVGRDRDALAAARTGPDTNDIPGGVDPDLVQSGRRELIAQDRSAILLLPGRRGNFRERDPFGNRSVPVLFDESERALHEFGFGDPERE